MVRVGAVKHPSEWPFCGYSEIQEPKRKNILINYKRLTELIGFETYDEVRTNHRRWVEDCLQNGSDARDDKWTKSIAVGDKQFIERTKEILGDKAKGRTKITSGTGLELREEQVPYGDFDLDLDNKFYWDV